MRKDISSIENAMSTKRKAEGHHLRPGSKLRTIKSVNCRPDSERDSGFSDASSEHMSTMDTTDAEDSPRPVVQQGPQCNSSGSQSSQLAVVGGSYSNLSPMIIMNNVLLKQPGDNPPALKPWGFRPAVEVVQPVVQQPQVVFLQPVVSQQASKEASSRHRRPKKYLPILKSYPKIAPHPGDGSSSSGRGSASSSSLSSSSSSSTYSSSSGSERGSTSTSSHRERYHRDKHQQKSLTRGPSNSGTTTTTTPSLPAPPSSVSPLVQQRLALPLTETSSSSSSSPAMERPLSAISQSELTPSLSLTPSNHASSKTQTLPLCVATEDGSCRDEPQPGDGDPETKRKRFCNTYNILSKSGLLDITLRTKELLRQNRRTQSDLDRLKEHTNLFLQAVQSGDNSICLKLQASLQEDDGGNEKERGSQSSLKAD